MHHWRKPMCLKLYGVCQENLLTICRKFSKAESGFISQFHDDIQIKPVVIFTFYWIFDSKKSCRQYPWINLFRTMGMLVFKTQGIFRSKQCMNRIPIGSPKRAATLYASILLEADLNVVNLYPGLSCRGMSATTIPEGRQ